METRRRGTCSGKRHRVDAAGLLALGALGSCARDSSDLAIPRPSAALPRECSDHAVACLALGEVAPPLERWPEARWHPIVDLLGRLIAAYQRTDFDSFLALHGPDLSFAAREQTGSLDELRQLCAEVGLTEGELPRDWLGTLGAFWRAYYREPPVAQFVPELARVELHDEGLQGLPLETWESSFESVRDRQRGRFIQHRLMVPHRRSIERIAADSGELCWLDVDLGFEGRGGRGRLVARFVLDGVLDEWFLHDAATVYSGGDRIERHLIL